MKCPPLRAPPSCYTVVQHLPQVGHSGCHSLPTFPISQGRETFLAISLEGQCVLPTVKWSHGGCSS